MCSHGTVPTDMYVCQFMVLGSLSIYDSLFTAQAHDCDTQGQET